MNFTEMGLSVGSLVQLRSGGPLMTISGFTSLNSFADCYYFNKAEDLTYVSVPVKALKKY